MGSRSPSFGKIGTQFLVVRAELAYRSPAHYGDTLSVDTRVAEMGQASFTFAHTLRERETQRVVVEGSATLVAVDLDRKVKRLDETLVTILQRSRDAVS